MNRPVSRYVVRLQVKRNFPSRIVVQKKYRVQLYFCSEFHELIEFSPTSLELFLVPPGSFCGYSPLQFRIVSVQQNVYLIEFQLLCNGKFQLLVTANSERSDVLMLPFLSDHITVSNEMESLYSSSLSNFRLFSRSASVSFIDQLKRDGAKTTTSCCLSGLLPFPEAADFQCLNPIIIKEVYGSTIGSHVYDSSVVMCIYLSEILNESSDLSNSSVIELGAGCGLVSIFLMKYFGFSSYVTDRLNQIPLLTENIQLNDLVEQSFVLEFEWNDPNQFQTLMNAIISNKSIVRYIVAADVLYDASVVTQFLRILTSLYFCCSDHTDDKDENSCGAVLVAQKNRDNSSTKEMQHLLTTRLLDLFPKDVNESRMVTVNCVFERYDVVIWQFQLEQKIE
jgi:predicted nicotinamide N-methyase